jgi:hypothetical protein
MLSKISKSIQKVSSSQASVVTAARCFSSNKSDADNLIKTYSNESNQVTQKESYLQFSKTPTSKNFGDLPRGEIPEPLKVNRPF